MPRRLTFGLFGAVLLSPSALASNLPSHFVLRGDAVPHAGSSSFDFEALARRSIDLATEGASEAPLQRRGEVEIVLEERDDIPDVARAQRTKRQSADQMGIALPGVGITAAGGLNSTYSGLIGVGTPPQLLPVAFDLGLPLIYVASAGCTSVACTNQALFNPTASTSINRTNQQYAMVGARGAAMGYRATDTVTIGPLVVPAVDMILATVIAGTNSSAPDAGVTARPANTRSGVIGLARGNILPSSLSYQGGAGTAATSYLRIEGRPNITFGNVLSRQPGMQAPVISLFLARGPAPSTASLSTATSGAFTGSELCIGCQNSNKFTGRILWRQPYVWDGGVNFSQLWAVVVSGVYVGTGTALYTKAPWNTPLILDNGVPMAAMPASMLTNVTGSLGLNAEPASTFQALYPSLKAIDGAYFSTACSSVASLPQLSLSFGFQRVVLDPRDMFLPIASSGMVRCAFLMTSCDAMGLSYGAIVGGAPILKNMVVALNSNDSSVGIAQSTNTIVTTSTTPNADIQNYFNAANANQAATTAPSFQTASYVAPGFVPTAAVQNTSSAVRQSISVFCAVLALAVAALVR